MPEEKKNVVAVTDKNKTDTKIKQDTIKKNANEGANDTTGNVNTAALVINNIGLDTVNSIIGNTEALKARQHLLNPKLYKREFKTPNPGNMPNNKDPYPVDLKIEELEFHKPDVKLYELTTHVHGKDAAIAAMKVGDAAEKRIVKLENMLATIYRLFFRLGTRLPVNCQYWGGTCPNFEKYGGIYCLADDRISTGKMVQIDQCLYCTRFEPVHGQNYEILNDLGANVATILDDNQAGYMNMEEYVKLHKVEEYFEPKKKAKFDLSRVESRDPSEKDLDSLWGDGLKMDWHLVPKEKQQVHINWRQSINDDGSKLMRLASFAGSELNAGKNLISGPGVENTLKKHRDAMDSYKIITSSGDSDKGGGDFRVRTSPFVKAAIDQGKNSAQNTDDTLNQIKAGLQKVIKTSLNGVSVDSIMLCVLAVIQNADGASVVSKYQKIANELATQNPALIIAAYAYGTEVILGNESKGVSRIDQANVRNDTTSNTSSSSSSTITNQFKLDWNNKEKWLWTDFADYLVLQIEKLKLNMEGLALFPKVVYQYFAVLPHCFQSPYDNESYAFPFTTEELKLGVYYSGYYREPRSNHIHLGVDLAVQEGTPIHAVADGTVTLKWDPDNNSINIQHSNGIYSRYLHCSQILVSEGQQVARGQVIGLVGGYGPSGPNTYPSHLHFEMSPGDAASSTTTQDPLSYFPKFQHPYKEASERTAIPAE